jgi:hypothetical protein
VSELLSDSEWQSIKSDLGRRVREIRVALYGENGGPLLAEELKVPYPSLHDFENGCTIPGESILRFIELTGVHPHWLLTGDGERFLNRDSAR